MSLVLKNRLHIQITISGSTYLALADDGKILSSSTNIATLLNAIQSSIVDHCTVEFQTGTYAGAGTYTNDKRFVKYIGNGAKITEAKLKIGPTAQTNILLTRGCIFEHFVFAGATAGVIIANSFNAQLSNVIFDSCDEALSVESTASTAHAEFLVLRNVHFNICKRSLVFKTPTNGATGSYVNSYFDVVTFNSSSGWNPGAEYKYIEIQSGAEVSEGKWVDMRLWFNTTAQNGVGIDHSGSSSRCHLFKPYFESFGGTNIGIRLNAAATGGFFFVGRPTWAGGAGFASKIANATDVHNHGTVSSWRQSHTITSSATADTFGSVVNCLTTADYAGIPTLYVLIGGTVGASETITVEIKAITYSSQTPTLTKTYVQTGTYPLDVTDYTALLPSLFYSVIDRFEVRAKSSGASTTATITFAGFGGGSALGKPVNDDIIIRKDTANLLTILRANSGVVGAGIGFNLGTTGLGLNYANIYGHAVTSSPRVGKITFQVANSGVPAERFAILADGALETDSYIDFTKIAAPADPGAEVGRLYFKTKDGSNNGLYVKLKIGGSIVEKELAFVA